MGVNARHSWREYIAALVITAAVFGGAAVIAPETALAACDGTSPPYEINGSSSTVILDADCGSGTPGQVNVTGDVNPTMGNGIESTGTGWKVDNSATVTGDPVAISFDGADGSVTNSGTLLSDGDGLVMNAGGTVTNNSSGEITGDGGYGVYIEGATGMLTNSGMITSKNDGVLLDAGGTVTNLSGTIQSSNSAGIYIEGGAGTVINSDMITGATYGVRMKAGGTVTNNTGGMITSNGITGRAGVDIEGGIGMVTNYGTITGVASGVEITGDAGSTLDNFGVISGTYTFGVGFSAGGTLTNHVGAMIQSSGVGASVRDVTVDNAGTISSSSTFGVDIQRGSITNRATGLIEGYDHGIFASFPISVENAGTITSTAANGMQLPGGTVTNTGTITGNNSGIVNQNAGLTVTNSGTIAGTSEYGIDMRAGGTITNQVDGTITGGEDGILFENFSGTVTNGGTITGMTNYGVNLTAGGTVTNLTDATITGASGLAGVHVAGATGMVDNAGEISGDDDPGVQMDAGGTVINRSDALIQGESDHAIEITGGAGDITNAGKIYSVRGVDVGGPDFATVLFGDFSDRFEIQPGSEVMDIPASGSPAPGIVDAGGGAGTDTLAFGGTGTGTFDLGDIDTGSGTQQYRNFEDFEVVDGDWHFSGTTTLAFNVSGGTLGGNATFGNLDIMSGGTIAPGNSIGTLTVNGPLSLDAGSTYEVEVNAAGQSDLIDVTGTVTLGGGTLSVLASGGGSYGQSTDYLIIANDGIDPVVGTFGTVSTDLAFLTPSVDYMGGTGNDVALTLTRNAATFGSVASTPNQRQAGMALADLDQTAGTDSATVYNTILGLNTAQAQSAFDLASGEIHASGQYLGGSMFDLYRRALQQQARAALAGPAAPVPPTAYVSTSLPASPAAGAFSALALADANAMDDSGAHAARPVRAVWISPLGGTGSIDGDGNAASFDWWTAGIAAGVERRGDAGAGRFVEGVSGGYLHGEGEASARASTDAADSLDLGLYAAWTDDVWSLSGTASYTATRHATSRDITIGALSRTADAAYWAHGVGGILEAARMFDLGAVTLSPLATVDAGWSGHGGASESGAGALDLTLAGENHGWLDTGLGLALGRRVTTASGLTVTAEARALWEHAFADTTPDQQLSFAGGPTAFTVEGPAVERDRPRIGVGLGIAQGRASLRARYDGTFLGNQQSHAASADLAVRF